jgi:hypothetical protein
MHGNHDYIHNQKLVVSPISQTRVPALSCQITKTCNGVKTNVDVQYRIMCRMINNIVTLCWTRVGRHDANMMPALVGFEFAKTKKY